MEMFPAFKGKEVGSTLDTERQTATIHTHMYIQNQKKKFLFSQIYSVKCMLLEKATLLETIGLRIAVQSKPKLLKIAKDFILQLPFFCESNSIQGTIGVCYVCIK